MSQKRFDYKCEKCGFVFEKIFDRNDTVPDRLKCPECKAVKSCYVDWSNSGSVHIPDNFKSENVNSISLNGNKRTANKKYHAVSDKH